VLDIREGGQDSQTPNPKCAIDDSGKCPKGEIPRTRFEGYELDNDYKPECGKEPTDKPKCAKGRYEEVTVSSGPDGNTAKITCERTRQFKNEKNKKVKDNEFRTKQKEDWEKREPQRKEDNERRKQNVEKLKKQQDELKEQMEKIKQENDKNDRKKARMGKCAPVVALIEALNVATSLRKRQEEESPYDW
jgi:hypothetical protein